MRFDDGFAAIILVQGSARAAHVRVHTVVFRAVKDDAAQHGSTVGIAHLPPSIRTSAIIHTILSNSAFTSHTNWKRNIILLQDEIKSAIRQIVEIIKKPLLAVRSSVMRIKTQLAVVVDKMKKSMLAIKNTVLGLGERLLFKKKKKNIQTRMRRYYQLSCPDILRF